jgi:hypothetical protein
LIINIIFLLAHLPLENGYSRTQQHHSTTNKLATTIGMYIKQPYEGIQHCLSIKALFPPRLADVYYEPIGMSYGRHKDLERVQQQRSSLLQVFSSRISVDEMDKVTGASPYHWQ